VDLARADTPFLNRLKLTSRGAVGTGAGTFYLGELAFDLNVGGISKWATVEPECF